MTLRAIRQIRTGIAFGRELAMKYDEDYVMDTLDSMWVMPYRMKVAARRAALDIFDMKRDVRS